MLIDYQTFFSITLKFSNLVTWLIWCQKSCNFRQPNF